MTRVLWGLLLVVACGSSRGSNDIPAGAFGGGGAGGAAAGTSRCPSGVGAWMSTSADPLSEGMAQYHRCEALCRSARDASCVGHDYDACVQFCTGLENESVNGHCTELVGALYSCFETLNEACNTPKRTVAGTCTEEYAALDCCFERYCADPANAGLCG